MKRITLLSLALGLVAISTSAFIAQPADAHPEHWRRFDRRECYVDRSVVNPYYHPVVSRILWNLGL